MSAVSSSDTGLGRNPNPGREDGKGAAVRSPPLTYRAGAGQGRAIGSSRWDLVLVHRPRLVALARRCGAGDDAEDVAQEALVRAATFERLDPERAGAFLSAVVARLVTDRHRRVARDLVLRGHARLRSAWWRGG